MVTMSCCCLCRFVGFLRKHVHLEGHFAIFPKVVEVILDAHVAQRFAQEGILGGIGDLDQRKLARLIKSFTIREHGPFHGVCQAANLILKFLIGGSVHKNEMLASDFLPLYIQL